MSSIRDEARQEAERRWPSPNSGLYEGLIIGFEKGAVWASGQADHVERIARVLAQTSTFTGQDALLLVKTAQKIAEVEKADREPSAAEVEAGARALWDARRSPTNHTWDAIAEGGLNRPYPTYPHIVDDIRREARAALLAAQEVRRATTDL